MPRLPHPPQANPCPPVAPVDPIAHGTGAMGSTRANETTGGRPLLASEPLTPVLEAKELSQIFWRKNGFLAEREALYAVRDVSFSILPGQTLGIIGESGCGKSTLARIVCGLLPPSSGEVRVAGGSLYAAKAQANYAEYRQQVCRTVQMIFQDPNSSLNPRMRVGESIAEPLLCLFPGMDSFTRASAVEAALDEVGIDPTHAKRFPHEFSGGQRQRIAIARALITKPQVVLCDEPTSSLDSSVQAQVLNLLDRMQQALGLSYVFISHDLAVVRHMSDTVAVMYAGAIVEEGPTDLVFAQPTHPYTQLLLASVPGFDTRLQEPALNPQRPRAQIAKASSTGCPFAGRCPHTQEVCLNTMPSLTPQPNNPRHQVRCTVNQ